MDFELDRADCQTPTISAHWSGRASWFEQTIIARADLTSQSLKDLVATSWLITLAVQSPRSVMSHVYFNLLTRQTRRMNMTIVQSIGMTSFAERSSLVPGLIVLLNREATGLLGMSEDPVSTKEWVLISVLADSLVFFRPYPLRFRYYTISYTHLPYFSSLEQARRPFRKRDRTRSSRMITWIPSLVPSHLKVSISKHAC
jgi:hypothetical protein